MRGQVYTSGRTGLRVDRQRCIIGEVAGDRGAPEATTRGSRLTGARLGLVFVGVWLVCGAVGALMITALDYGNQKVYSQLEKHGVVVDAVVTGTEPNNHNTVFYSFLANGRRYSSGDRSWPPNPDASQLTVGGRVYVVYDRRDPSVSCACDPHKTARPLRWWRGFIAGLLLGSVAALVITLGIRRRIDRESRFAKPACSRSNEVAPGGETPPRRTPGPVSYDTNDVPVTAPS